MTSQREATKTEAIEQVVAQLHEKLPAAEAALVEAFARQFYGNIPAEDLRGRSVLDLYGAVLSLWHFMEGRRPGEAKARLYNPRLEDHGWRSTHSIVEVVSEDMPFLVDTVTLALRQHGLATHLIVHPVVCVERDAEGRLIDVAPYKAGDEGTAESVIYVEVDRLSRPAAIESLQTVLERSLLDVRAAVEDWGPMRERLAEVVRQLEERPPPVDPEELSEAIAFLRWIDDHHFTYLGFREYTLKQDGDGQLVRSVPGTGLGVLRHRGPGEEKQTATRLTGEAAAMAVARNALVLTKANSRATVHRSTYLDYVGVRRFNAKGKVVGEWRFLGLYASTVYHTSPRLIPVLRQRVQRVLGLAGYVPGGHDEKVLLDILESYPRDELLQTASGELYTIAMGIMPLKDRPRVRLFVRPDPYGRFLSCLVFVPRDRYNTDVRRRIEGVLRQAFRGEILDFNVSLSESQLARVDMRVRTDATVPTAEDVEEVEQRLVVATRTWADDLKAALLEQLDEEAANRLYQQYASAFPAGYREEFPARNAVLDIQRIEALTPESSPGMSLYAPLEAPPGTLRFKLFWAGRAPLLSDVLPLLEAMGLKVVDERPYEVRPLEGEPCWISDFTLMTEDRGDRPVDQVKETFQEAFAAVWHGHAESDGFNRLVLRAGLTWREVAVIRAYAKYLRQAGTTFSTSYMERTVSATPVVAGLLIDLFRARFEPLPRGRREARAARVGDLAKVIERSLDRIMNLDEDRILRNLYRMVLATVRTNWFQTGAQGRPKAWIAMKLDPSLIELLPEPRPVAEIFVYSPRLEAVHLRGARVARGGIRWSDRQEDFRTEVLGLMKAQKVKNAVIVPGGAKGGFVVKRGLTGLDRDEVLREVTEAYSTFMRGLLDLTDNYARGEAGTAEGRPVPPPDVICYDDPDPYLVVAADKGTATFSDLANSIAAEYGFWLGDAFASGGSAGYDHKKMGITARGAWESVKRHFRELGVDPQREPFTVAGIGDMSGDVFGNAMLLSDQIRLVAAFNHQHIFLDPDPDPAVGFAERRRLFELPRSGWNDYDPAKLSKGGGVWERTAKSIPLSSEARRALGVEEEALTPPELIRAILCSPVDLLFNGGIGTYVKAERETADEVGDRANDAVRVNGAELRARIVGEGGNLGLTQLGRIEYALAGGRLNTDFIDNSAGVDTSDHEVNIKILLDQVVASGDMTVKQRNELLVEMTDEIAALVLRDNYRQAEALSVSEVAAPKLLDRHARVIRALEREGRLKRKLEFLPDERALADRRNRGLGLTRPELAVLLAYVKNDLKLDLLGSDVLEDPYFSEELMRYFPAPLRERFSQQAQRHRLRRELIATHITNSMVNRVGTSFITVVTEETGATPADIARAYTVAREVFELRELWTDVERLDDQVPAHVQTAMLLDGRRLAERGAVWLLRNRRQPIDVAAEVKRFGPGVAEVARSLPKLLTGGATERYGQRVRRLEEQGVPADLAQRVAWLSPILSALDVVEVATAAERGVEEVAAVYFELADRLDLDWLRRQILDLPTESHWDERARDALRDDLYTQHRALTSQVLRAGRGVEADDVVATWEQASPTAIRRYLDTLAELKEAGAVDLAMASVALRELRSLARTARA